MEPEAPDLERKWSEHYSYKMTMEPEAGFSHENREILVPSARQWSLRPPIYAYYHQINREQYHTKEWLMKLRSDYCSPYFTHYLRSNQFDSAWIEESTTESKPFLLWSWESRLLPSPFSYHFWMESWSAVTKCHPGLTLVSTLFIEHAISSLLTDEIEGEMRRACRVWMKLLITCIQKNAHGRVLLIH